MPGYDAGSEVALVASTTGTPTGGVVLDRIVGAGDVTLVFQLTLTGAQGVGTFGVDFSVFSPFTVPTTAVGTIPGAEVDVVSGSVQAAPPFAFVDFDALGGPMVTDPFFVSFASSPEGAILGFEALGGFIEVASAAVVPEVASLPAAALAALCAGLLGRARISRRRAG